MSANITANIGLSTAELLSRDVRSFRNLMSSRLKAILITSFCVVLPCSIFVVAAWIAASNSVPQPQPVEIGDIKHKVDVLINHINFVSAWSLGTMGALAALGVKLLDMGRWTSSTRQVLFMGFGLLAASLYAGHESRLAILNAYLGAGYLDYKSVFVNTMTWLQVFGLVAGCVAFPIILGLQACQTTPAAVKANSP